MDKKPTTSTLKNEIDKLKKYFEQEKLDKDDKINQLISTITDIGVGKNDNNFSCNDYCSEQIKKITEDFEYQMKQEFNTNRSENICGDECSGKFQKLIDDFEKRMEQITLNIYKTEEKLKQIEHQRYKNCDEFKKLTCDFEKRMKQMELNIENNIEEEFNKNEQKFDALVSKLAQSNGSKNVSINISDNIKFSPLSKNAHKPIRGNEYLNGIDLRSAYDYLVPANGNKLVKTDLKIKYPVGYFGKTFSRSELSLNYNVEVGGEIIDSDGGFCIILNNLSSRDFYISEGDCVAKLISFQHLKLDIE